MASIVIVDGLDLASVRVFLSVVELGSVSKAARRSGMAQPSATARLQKLERQLGVALLDRGPSGSTVTPAGVRVAAACAALLEAAESLVDRADSLRDEQRHLPLAGTRHAIEHFLPRWVAATSLDEVRLHVTDTDTLQVTQAVRSGDAELGLADGPYAPIGLRSEILATEQLVVVVGSSHRWADQSRSVTVHELNAETLVLPRRGSGTRDVVEAALAGHESGVVGEHVEVDSLACARIAAINGEGVAFVPRCRVRQDLERGL
ncbi:MAG: LysR family transcriptional regulator, partial [Ilumatobacter sp.]